MKINSCSVKFYLELTKVRHDGHAIFCRIIIDRKKAEFKLPFCCCVSDWDDVSGQPKSKSPDAQIKLGEIARIQSIINNALKDANRAGKSISSREIKELVTGEGVQHYALLSLVSKVSAMLQRVNCRCGKTFIISWLHDRVREGDARGKRWKWPLLDAANWPMKTEQFDPLKTLNLIHA